MKSVTIPNMRRTLILALSQCLFVFILFSMLSGGVLGEEWNADLKPGDVVCLWDIHDDDPLVSAKTSSFKYWYRKPNARSYYHLRPEITKLKFKIVQPGLDVVLKSNHNARAAWFSGWLLVEDGGEDINPVKAADFKVGQTVLYKYNNRFPITNWQLIHFEAARFRKAKAFVGCKRTYKKEDKNSTETQNKG